MPPVTIDLRNLPRAVNRVYYPLFGTRDRFLVLMGGAGSGKSHYAAQKILVRIVTESGHRIVVMRKVARTLRVSVFHLFKTLIKAWGWSDHFTFNLTDMSIRFNPNGSEILFMGLDDPDKIKSITAVTGFWLEEATEMNEADLEQVNLRLRGITATYKQIILSFNPISSLHWLKKRFWDAERLNTHVLETTYRDNAFLDPEYGRELEALRDRDEMLWRIYARGEWGMLKGLIYSPWLVDEWPLVFEERFYGVDFGFNHPSAVVEIQMRDGEPYITERVYETKLTTADLSAKMTRMKLDKKAPMYCDAAEPDRIEELRRKGWNALKADKAQGSVMAGIDLVKSLRVHTRPENVNVNKEAGIYKWREDRDGNPMDEPVKFADHSMDAIRYALHTHLGGPERRISTAQPDAFEGIGIFARKRRQS